MQKIQKTADLRSFMLTYCIIRVCKHASHALKKVGGRLKWLQNKLAIERLELSILAMLARRFSDCAMLTCV